MTNERRLAHSPQAAVAAYTPAPGYSRDLDESDLPLSLGFTPIKADKRGIWFGFPGNERQLPQGVVVRPLDRKTTRVRWATDTEKEQDVFGENDVRPVCQSADGKSGKGILVDMGVASGDCGVCPQAAFPEKGAPPCTEVKTLRVLLNVGGIEEEAQIDFKSTGMPAYKTIALAVHERGWDNVLIALRTELMGHGERVWGEWRVEVRDAPPSLSVGAVNAPAREVPPPPPVPPRGRG